MKVQYKKISLPFHHPFTISKGTKTHQDTMIVELDHFGIKGYGEATAISYYDVTVENMIAELEKKRLFIEKFAFSDPERYWHYLHHLFPSNPFLVCALDMAGWDIYGKMKRKQLHEIWGINLAEAPVSDFTIGIDNVENMIVKMKENPWPIYKIKVGFDGDLETISELRKHTDSVFRVDVNEGWDLETALHKIPHLHDLGVELVEQPLPKENWEDMKILFEQSSIPLFADESCVHETDVDKCKGFFNGINIKLTKCSGITPARRMIQNARNLDLKVMIGCMNESTVGSAAIAQLAALVDYIDNDGTLLQSAQVGSGITFDYGKMNYGTTSGLGVEVEWGNGG